MRFLRGLIKNNDREWFEQRRGTYERALKVPLLALIEEINAELAGFAPEYVRPAHKIAMRIYRDIRFSPDKRPYKRHMSAWWSRQGMAKSSGAGVYLQMGPLGSFLAAGVYAPEREAMLTLRRWFAENHERYRRALVPLLRAKGALPAMAILESAVLTRNPKGFAPDHPAGDLLRQRNWGVSVALSEEQVLGEDLGEVITAHLRRMMPLLEMLNAPLLEATPSVAERPMF